MLVHAATGGMGLLLVEWAQHMGAAVIGTVSTDEKVKIAREASADNVILYSKQDFAEEVKKLTGGAGVDYVIDGVGKTTFTKNLDALKPRGWGDHLRDAERASRSARTQFAYDQVPDDLGALSNYTATRDELLRRARDVFAGLREGWLKLRIYRTFPMAHAAEAHQLLEATRPPVNFLNS